MVVNGRDVVPENLIVTYTVIFLFVCFKQFAQDSKHGYHFLLSFIPECCVARIILFLALYISKHLACHFYFNVLFDENVNRSFSHS